MSKEKTKAFLVYLPSDAVKDLDNMAHRVNCSRNFLVKTAVMSFLGDYTLRVMESSLKEKSCPLTIDELSD